MTNISAHLKHKTNSQPFVTFEVNKFAKHQSCETATGPQLVRVKKVLEK